METTNQSVNDVWSSPPYSALSRQYVQKNPEVVHAIQLTQENFDEVVILLKATPYENRSALAFTDILLHSTRVRLGDYIIATSLGYLKMSQLEFTNTYTLDLSIFQKTI